MLPPVVLARGAAAQKHAQTHYKELPSRWQ